MDLKTGIAEGNIGLIIGVKDFFFVAVHAESFSGGGPLKNMFSETFCAIAEDHQLTILHNIIKSIANYLCINSVKDNIVFKSSNRIGEVNFIFS